MYFDVVFYGNSPMARASAGGKLLSLMLGGSLLFAFANWPYVLAAAGLTGALYGLAKVPPKIAWKPIDSHRYVWLLILGFHAFNHDLLRGCEITGTIIVISSYATLVNATTQVSEMIEAIKRLCGYLKPLGVQPEKVALAISLALRFIPLLRQTYAEIVLAQKARGLDKNLMALILPTMIKTLKMADEVAEAIEARGTIWR